MNFNSAKSILTLRYDNTQNSNLSKLKCQDIEKKENFSTEQITNQLITNLQKIIPDDYSKSITVSLSGGIDSSLMLCILKQSFPENEINAISIKFSESYDETEAAARIAHKIGVNHHVVEIDNFLEKLPDAISITGLPFWDIHWIYVVEAAKKFSNYLVSGDGGDELFGGYVFRYSKYLSKINSTSSVDEKIIAYLSCHERDHIPEQDNIFTKKVDFVWNDIYDILRPYFDNSLSPIEQVFLADYNGKLLYNFSPIANNINNYFNLKSLRPILDSNLIKIATHIPSQQKYDFESNVGKIPLRKILLNLKKDHLIQKEKLGFSVNPINLWISYGFELCENYLNNSRLVSDKWINPIWIKKHLKKQLSDIRYINKFFGLLAFEIWYRLFITKEINSNLKLT